ncbi:MauE/DoxX family redox-associated membrane protein [Fodinicola feengrottensis]|uniref:MauE/DoxX family redox-associated membrane protein n=1 Tax=Fodinicola feengrottensis TaxID=435914 RepID=UPI002441C207|nr:MauE/DoxX family redox-associated membrane protein [Fodinicola feengrottensis]
MIAAMLAWAGTYKLLGRTVGVAASRSALPKLLGSDQRAVVGYRVTGAVELTVAVLLLVAGSTPVPAVPAVAATAVGVSFLAYLGYAKVAVPKSSCGCTSSRAEPISWRGFSRAAIVAVGGLVATIAAITSTGSPWWSALASQPLPAVLVVAAEVVLVLSLSPGLRPDLDHAAAHLADEVRPASAGRRPGHPADHGDLVQPGAQRGVHRGLPCRTFRPAGELGRGRVAGADVRRPDRQTPSHRGVRGRARLSHGGHPVEHRG